MKEIICLFVLLLGHVCFAEVPLRVGLYGDAGSDSTGALNLFLWLARSPEISTTILTGESVQSDALTGIDLVVMPGGTATAYDSLGEVGRAKLKSYIENGGKYLGTGTGTALLMAQSNDLDKCLNIIPYTSNGKLDSRLQLYVEINSTGATALGIPAGYGEDRSMRYSGGPWLVYKTGGIANASFSTWGVYRSEINLKGRVTDRMLGSSAIVGGTFGAGKVVAFTHEPQYEYHKKRFIVGAIKWLTGREVTIPFHPHRRGATSVAIAMGGVTLASVEPVVRSLDGNAGFDITGFDPIDATFDSLERLDAMLFPLGSDHADFVAGGISRTLVTETAAAGVKPFVWGSGTNVLPLQGATTCTDVADALSKVLTAFPTHE